MKKGSHETRKTPITIPNVTAGNQFDKNNFTSVFKSTRSDSSTLSQGELFIHGKAMVLCLYVVVN